MTVEAVVPPFHRIVCSRKAGVNSILNAPPRDGKSWTALNSCLCSRFVVDCCLCAFVLIVNSQWAMGNYEQLVSEKLIYNQTNVFDLTSQ